MKIKNRIINGNLLKVVYSENSDELVENGLITANDKEMDYRAQEAVKAAILKATICKKPIAKYDAKSKKAYLVYPDGSIK